MGCHLIHTAPGEMLYYRILSSQTFTRIQTKCNIQVMLHDRFLYDRANGQWTVSRFLEDLNIR